MQGDHDKPRPALVIQSDVCGAMCSRTVLLLTSDPADAPLLRVRVEPTPANGLHVPSWVMIDKAMTMRPTEWVPRSAASMMRRWSP
nr:type II toxin-antitoxin system PemK/MazF family toxin [Paracoccus sp. S-4012]